MDKKELRERDICTKFFTPAIKQTNWRERQAREEVKLTNGRIIDSILSFIFLVNTILLKQIQPGLPTKGQVVFDVPTGITCNLQVEDSIRGTDTE